MIPYEITLSMELRPSLDAITETTRAVLFGGRHVSFYKIFGWGIIELLESR